MCECSLPPPTATTRSPSLLFLDYQLQTTESKLTDGAHQRPHQRLSSSTLRLCWPLLPLLDQLPVLEQLPLLLCRRPLLQLSLRPPSAKKRSKRTVSSPSSARASSAGSPSSSRRIHASSSRIIRPDVACILLEEKWNPAEDARALEGKLTAFFDLFSTLGGRGSSCSRGRGRSSRGGRCRGRDVGASAGASHRRIWTWWFEAGTRERAGGGLLVVVEGGSEHAHMYTLFSPGRRDFIALSATGHAGDPCVHYGASLGPDRAP